MTRSRKEICVFKGKSGVEEPCTRKRQPGRLTCKEHSEMFDRVRAELDAQKFNRAGKRAKKVPTCCAPGCFNERVAPDPFCDGHKDMAVDD